MKYPILYGACTLFCLSQVCAKPFYWGDTSYLTTKEPLLRRAFNKLNDWFKDLIDAHPSSTWYWKEHIYGQTYWKNPKILRAWLKRDDITPLRYMERSQPKRNFDPLGFPGVTYPKRRPDYIDDNVLSIPDTEELEQIEARQRDKNAALGITTKKKKAFGRKVARGFGDDDSDED